MALVGIELETLVSEADALTTRPPPCASNCWLPSAFESLSRNRSNLSYCNLNKQVCIRQYQSAIFFNVV